MPGQTTDRTGMLTERRQSSDRRPPRPIGEWLASHTDELAAEWLDEIRLRDIGQGEAVDRVVEVFLKELTNFLPALLGRHGEHVQPLWERATALFGVMAAKRGLAAGEVIEELQILRTLIIRRLYEDPPEGRRPTLRDVLRINRFVDRGVTHASVGHTDAMFYELLEGSEGGSISPVEAAEEAEVQLGVILQELAEIVGTGVPAGSSAEN